MLRKWRPADDAIDHELSPEQDPPDIVGPTGEGMAEQTHDEVGAPLPSGHYERRHNERRHYERRTYPSAPVSHERRSPPK